MIWVLNQLVWFSLGSYRNDLERDRSTCYSHSLQWQFFGPCVQEVAHVCKSNTNIQCLHSPLRLLLKICDIQIWPLSCYFLQNLLMKTYFRGWLFNSQSTCFLTACHVLGAKKKKKNKIGGVGALWGHLSSIGSWRQSGLVTSLIPSSLVSFLCKEWESFLARSAWVVLQCFHGTLGRARTTEAEGMKRNNQSQIDAFEIFESFSIFLLHNHNTIRIQIQ